MHISDGHLRDWFAAHAPAMQSWFSVHWFGWPDNLPDKAALRWSNSPLPAVDDDSVERRWKALAWSERQRACLAWPWYYADAMLGERDTIPGNEDKR